MFGVFRTGCFNFKKVKIAPGVNEITIINIIERIAERAFPAESNFRFLEFLKLERANTKYP